MKLGLLTGGVVACAVVVVAAASGQVTTPLTGASQPPGGGGGRGPSPGTLIWNDKCAGCHAAGGRAPNLFEEAWLSRMSDESIAGKIKNGGPGTEMAAFGSALSELQV